MNNTHQELIAEKVVELADKIWNQSGNHTHNLLDEMITKTLQDTIDTVLEGERERLLQALPKEIIVHEYMSSENTPVRKGWNVYRTAIIKALTQPPCQP